MSLRRFGRALPWFLLGAVSSAFAARQASDIPRDVLKGIDAMERLPAEGFHLVESQGRLLLVSTNGHYVVIGGRIVDLWNQLEVQSVADVEATRRVPLARMGIHARELGGVSVGREGSSPAVTVFLDPASSESRKLLPELRKVAGERRVDLIFVPAQPTRAGVSRALICHHEAVNAFFTDERVPNAMAEREVCGTQELGRARVTAELLGIKSLPFSIAANGVTVAGTPAHYAAFINANQESHP